MNNDAYRFSVRDSTEFRVDEGSSGIVNVTVTFVNSTSESVAIGQMPKYVNLRDYSEFNDLIKPDDPDPFYGCMMSSVMLSSSESKTVQLPACEEEPLVLYVNHKVVDPGEDDNYRAEWSDRSQDGYVMIFGNCQIEFQT